MDETIKPRMRTIDAAIRELKEADPETAITKYYLRQLIVTNQIPHVKAGKKYLLDMRLLEDFLGGGSSSAPALPETVGGIRKLEPRLIF